MKEQTWRQREKAKCVYLFERFDLRDVERSNLKAYLESLEER